MSKDILDPADTPITEADVTETEQAPGKVDEGKQTNVSARFSDADLVSLDNSSFRHRERNRSVTLRRIVALYFAEHPEDIAEIKFI